MGDRVHPDHFSMMQLDTLLREQFGTMRVVVFGSLTRCEFYTRWSDIDLAAWGIPPER